MPTKKKTTKKSTRSKTKKAAKPSPSKNLWIGSGHLYLPEDETIRKDF